MIDDANEHDNLLQLTWNQCRCACTTQPTPFFKLNYLENKYKRKKENSRTRRWCSTPMRRRTRVERQSDWMQCEAIWIVSRHSECSPILRRYQYSKAIIQLQCVCYCWRRCCRCFSSFARLCHVPSHNEQCNMYTLAISQWFIDIFTLFTQYSLFTSRRLTTAFVLFFVRSINWSLFMSTYQAPYSVVTIYDNTLGNRSATILLSNVSGWLVDSMRREFEFESKLWK